MKKEKEAKFKKEYKIDFGNDIKQILSWRTATRFEEALRSLMCQAEKRYCKEGAKIKKQRKKTDDSFQDNMYELYSRLYKDELNTFFGSEIDRYAIEYNESMFLTYCNARCGDNASLFNLIKWDKTWLFVEWAKRKVLEKENKDDQDFFDNLSKALKENTRFDLQYGGEGKSILDTLQIMKTTMPLSEYGSEKKFLGDIYKILAEDGKLEDTNSKSKEQVKILVSAALVNLKKYGSMYQLRKMEKNVEEIFKILFPNSPNTESSLPDLAMSIDDISKGDTKHERKIIEGLAKDVIDTQHIESNNPLADRDYFMKLLKRKGLKS